MHTLNCRGRLVTISSPWVMGIINVTPDSFYAASRSQHVDAVLHQAEQMLQQGADILDMGAQSTRPGSKQVSCEEELERLIDKIAAVHRRFPEAILSVDTFYSRVAAEAVQAGASMVNDISGGILDENMLHTVAGLNVPYVIMHMPGNPQTMQLHTEYSDVTLAVLDDLVVKKEAAIKAGIHDIIIDPGFGFGKTASQNFELLKKLDTFRILGCPVLAGLSRKSTISKTLGITAAEALNGTTVLNTIALIHGADILRVHDVKEAKEAITLFTAMNG